MPRTTLVLDDENEVLLSLYDSYREKMPAELKAVRVFSEVREWDTETEEGEK